VFCDKKFTIALSKNHIFQKKTKQFDTRYHFIRELVNSKEISLEFCRSKEQIVDIFTKSLARDAFQKLCSCLGVSVVVDI
jgi:hypothetical protein